MTYVKIAKPGAQVYTGVNTAKPLYDEPSISYDDPLIFYDGFNPNQYTNIAKPSSQAYTNIPKPT